MYFLDTPRGYYGCKRTFPSLMEAPIDNTASGRAFAADLKALRKEKDITLRQIYDATKIPLDVLDKFEETALFGHPSFNEVYLRSLVRNYAQLVGISQAKALAALEDALGGVYEGGLKRGAAVAPPPEETPSAGKAPPAADAKDAASADDAAAAPEAESEDADPAEAAPEATGKAEILIDLDEDELPDPASLEPPLIRRAPSRRRETPAERTATANPRRGEPIVISTSSTPGPDASYYTVAPAEEKQLSRGRLFLLIGGAALVVLIGVLVIFALRNMDGTPAAAPPPGTAAVEDTSTVDGDAGDANEAQEREAPSATPVVPPRAVITLGDSIRVAVVAARDKVDHIKVQVDDDLRRPYWIEQGDTVQFAARNRIILEQKLDVVRLLLEGQPYPTTAVDSLGRVVITRQVARAYLSDPNRPVLPSR